MARVRDWVALSTQSHHSCGSVIDKGSGGRLDDPVYVAMRFRPRIRGVVPRRRRLRGAAQGGRDRLPALRGVAGREGADGAEYRPLAREDPDLAGPEGRRADGDAPPG